jgi:hypothetical protein
MMEISLKLMLYNAKYLALCAPRLMPCSWRQALRPQLKTKNPRSLIAIEGFRIIKQLNYFLACCC